MMLPNITAMNFQIMADTSGAMNIMRGYVNPTMQLLAGLASIICVLFLVKVRVLNQSDYS